MVILLIVIYACCGCDFSKCLTFLKKRFGLSKVSVIHGPCLSAWVFAGPSRNQLARVIIVNTTSLYLLFTFVGCANPLSGII
ncbi:MAG: hypothetical protein HUJ51_01675 [Eggerthellaceae bacterium]|nr:hypothetical protein [Eggerthellaceae bacterium]